MAKDYFYPFKDSEFDVARAVDELALSKPQLGLIKRMLERMSFCIWFDEKDSEPGLVLVFFWEGADGVDEAFATINLLPIFKTAVDDRDMIGDEEEILALEKFRVVIDAAIAARRAQGGDQRHEPATA